jgi:hypothetical protein
MNTETGGEPAGIILVAHEVLSTISQEEMLAALPPSYRVLPRAVVNLRSVTAILAELGGFNWEGARRRQAAEIRAQLLPLLESNPAWRVQYFGAAPIPLAISFGFMLGGFRHFDIYQQRHDTNTWEWPSAQRSARANFAELVLPTERVTAPGDLVIRVSISHQIDPADSAGVIELNIGEVDLRLETPNEDALESRADLDELKAQFDRVIDWAHRFRPNAQLHVFAAITVGAACKLGTGVNPTIHSPVHLYQYAKSVSPHYQHALMLQQAGSENIPLTTDERNEAGQLRQMIQEEIGRMQVACTQARSEAKPEGQTWLKCAFPEIQDDYFYGPLHGLAPLCDTAVAESGVDLTATEGEGEFAYESGTRLWRFDDRLLAAIIKQFPDSKKRRQAGRLLLLHESIHQRTHGLTQATARQIRRVPKIVEELDYQADVWAYVHDFALQVDVPLRSDENVRNFFLEVVNVGLSTFWAFDAGQDMAQIEIRRLNRYLIWYWQLLRLERCSNLHGILQVLADRPLIEVAGPAVETFDDRIFYSLEPRRFHDPELAVLYENRLVRHGNSMGSRVIDLLRGFRERHPAMILDALKSIFDQRAV